ncbi:MAG: hypothetical protein JKY94_17505 [Rhodobacteraceae bacterium]|nr:hypothetical protein [Paracoccaceae bacterium]
MAFLGLLSKKGASAIIQLEDGQEMTLHFYPISVRRLLTLQDMMGSVAKALMTLTSGNNYEDRIRSSHQKEESTGYTSSVSEPVDPEIIAKRQGYKDEALDEMFRVLMAEENAKVVAQLLMDSLRDEDFSGMDALEFLDQIEGGALTQMLMAFGKANKKVLPGPLAKKLQKVWSKITKNLETEDEGDESLQDPPQEEPSESVSSGLELIKETPKTDAP